MANSPRKLTIHHLADELGLSPATVSLALNQDPRVAEKTRRKVCEYADQCGFSVNSQARNFRLGRTGTVAMVLHRIDSDFWSGVVKAVEDTLQDTYSVILCNSDGNLDKELNILQNLRRRNVDGIILQPASRSEEHLEALTAAGIKLVLFEETANPTLSFVKGDDYGGSVTLTRSSITAGHRRIRLVTVKLRSIGVAERVRGFADTVTAAGIAGDCDVLTVDNLEAPSLAAVLKDLSHFSLLIGIDDRISCHLLKMLQRQKVRIPEDISLVGWNNSSFLPFLTPALTSVEIPTKLMGARAAAILQSQLAGSDAVSKEYLEETIHWRESFCHKLQS